MVNRKGCKTDLYVFISSSPLLFLHFIHSLRCKHNSSQLGGQKATASSKTFLQNTEMPSWARMPLHAAPCHGSAEQLPRLWEQTNACLGKGQIAFAAETPETPWSTASVATVFVILYQPGSLSNKVLDKDNTNHFSPCFLCSKSSQRPRDNSCSMPERDYPEWALGEREILPALSSTQPIPLGHSEDGQISLKAH